MKFLIGAAYADFNVEHMDVTMNGDQWSINADAKLTAALGKSNFSYDDGNDPATIDPNRGGKVDGIDDYSFSLPGFGLAFDFGATYQVLDNLTVSASITDLGFISWKDVNMASSRGEYTFDGFTDIWVSGDDESNKIGDQFENLGDDLNRVFSIYDDGKGKKPKALPPRSTSAPNTRCRSMTNSVSVSSILRAYTGVTPTTRGCSRLPSAPSSGSRLTSTPAVRAPGGSLVEC